MKRMLILAAWVCLVSAAPAFAQYAKPKAESKPAAESSSVEKDRAAERKARLAMGRTPDAAFLIAAAQSGMAGLKFGEMAIEKASDPAVKRYAKEIAAASGKMTEELKPLLDAQRAAAPSELDQRNQAVETWLAKLSGAEFDRAFVSNMRAMRATDLMVFERASTMSRDETLKTWATKNLPALKTQQQTADELTKKIAG